ncbi:fatty acid desaturase [Variovorax sp. OV700]|uniref:acyl-CoA desaturase n=1 Tax=Variovorax sp. OV700 TaxID=1882826 RepID=UPI00088C0F31|nr:fatty acid desaturase [Variovorax sp. OV700]SDH56201.1 Delta-9 acyl-phospholipid desaturase [Variovorax sp. OV700]
MIHRMQRQHVLLFNVVPHLAVLGLPLYWSSVYAGPTEWLLFIGGWFLTTLGITAGFHRLVAHKSYAAHPRLLLVLAWLGSMGAQGAIASWVAIHRTHHECSDVPGDVHSPNLHGDGFLDKAKGLFHSHLGWMWRHPYPNIVRVAPDVLRNKVLMRINGQYHYWIAAGLIIPAAIGAAVHRDVTGAVSGLLWGGLFRMVLLQQMTWTVTSLAHLTGRRRFDTPDRSGNLWWLSLPSLGESWHNNHHRFANSPKVGLDWYNLDLTYWFIRSMSFLGLASDLRVPKQEQIAAREAEWRVAEQVTQRDSPSSTRS